MRSLALSATGAILARLKGISLPIHGRKRTRKIDTNPLPPFTYDDILYIITEEKKKASDAVATNVGGKMRRRVSARSTPASHSSAPAPELGRGSAVDIPKEKARELADRGRCVQNPDGTWSVFSLTSTNKYKVALNAMDPKTGGRTLHTCTCPSWELHQDSCKHIRAVLWANRQDVADRREGNPPRERIPEGEPVQFPRKTYKQDWPAYEAAQTNEKAEFLQLLSDLCRMIEEPERKRGRGRPQASLAAQVFAACFKVYSGFSGRRFMTDLRDAADKKHISEAISYSGIARFLEDEESFSLLRSLVMQTALPLKGLESKFAADSSGFSACKFDRWYDAKYGRMHQEHSWVKVHIMTGVLTNCVTAVEIGNKEDGDCPMFKPLVKATATGFKIEEASADKAYSSYENHDILEAIGATPYIAFKIQATEGKGGLWAKMYHTFCLQKDEFLNHYHQRSNIESTFSMVKRKFGDSVRSKTDIAMKNECLAKLICHNICCVIQSAYEFGVEPIFATNSGHDTKMILKFHL
jgi:transposase